MKYTFIAFDIDGTLLDTAAADLTGLREVLLWEMGLDLPIEALTGALGVPSRDILRQYGVSGRDLDRLAGLWMRRMHAHFDTARVFPGIEAALQRLRARGLRLGIVTSKDRAEYAQDFSPFALEAYFDAVVTASDTAAHKPRPEPLLKILELAQVGAREALYVGDSAYDRDCARAAGVDFALAQWGSAQPEMEGATWRLSCPEDIPAVWCQR